MNEKIFIALYRIKDNIPLSTKSSSILEVLRALIVLETYTI